MPASESAFTSPRASASSTAPSAPSAATSSAVIRSPPSGAPGARSARSSTTTAATTSSAAAASPPAASTEWRRISPTGAPARSASTATARIPSPQPTTTPCERCRSRFGSGQNAELVPPRAEPRQPLPDALDVAAHPGGGQDREREEQRGGLSTHEEQAPTRDLPGFPRGGELVHRRGEIQEERLRAQRRAGPRRGGGESVDLPRMHAVGGERRRPGVGAVEALEPWERGELVEALGHEERRLGDAERIAEARRVLAGEAPERQRRDERPLADLHEAQALDARHAAGAAELDDLAASPGVHVSGSRPDVSRTKRPRSSAAARFVSCPPMRRSFSCTARTGAPGARPASVRSTSGSRSLARDAVSRDPEIGVDHRDRALVRRHALERAGERLVLRHQASADDRGQRGGGGGDPQREQSRAAGAVDEPVPGEPQRIADSSASCSRIHADRS